MTTSDNQLTHDETSVLAAVIANLPRPLSACSLISNGLPQFDLSKDDAIAAVYALQEKCLLRFRQGYISLTRRGWQDVSEVIAATHSLH